VSDRDAIVIGGGHNGLTAAALLARAGRRVVVLERRAILGGLAADAPFHPGYRGAGLLQDTSTVSRDVAERLGLVRFGLRWRNRPAELIALGADGDTLRLGGDARETTARIARRSAADGERYLAFRETLARLAAPLRRILSRPPFDPVELDGGLRELLGQALALRRLGRHDLTELLRVLPLSVADWLDEWFSDPLLASALALPALRGGVHGPRAPGTAAGLLFDEALAGPGIEGGAERLAAALVGAAEAAGVELRTEAEATRILVGGNGVEGVELRDGSIVRATLVAASCDPRRTLLELLPPGWLAERTEQQVASYRMRGAVGRVLLALDRPLRFAGIEGGRAEFARTAGTIDDLERAFDAIKYRQVSTTPVLELHVPTVSREDLAPRGHDVVSILVHCAPHELDPSWDDGQRERLGNRVLEVLEQHAPGVTAAVVAREVHSPRDLEVRYALSGGHLLHGEPGLDQRVVRPVPGFARYATPLRGLVLCGSGCHPGGGLTCLPGALAAETVLAG